MTFERAKTILLVMLIAASIALSYLIWEGLLPPAAPSGSRQPGGTFWGPGVDPLDLILPARIVVHLEPDLHSTLYPGEPLFTRAWQAALDRLLELGGQRDGFILETVDQALWRQTQAEPSLEYVFDFPLPGQVWSRLLDYSHMLGFNQPVKRMLFQLEPKPALLLADESAGTIARLPLGSADNNWPALWEQLEAAELPYYDLLYRDQTPFGLYLPRADLTFPLLKTEREQLDPEVVAGSFFADLSLTRRISERDGATIYTDGRQGLRVWPSGRLEYNAPEQLAGASLPLSEILSRAVRFVTQHGGWPVEMRLAQIKEAAAVKTGVFWRLVFRAYAGGLPVVNTNFGLELRHSSRGVASYRRQLALPADELAPAKLSSARLQEYIEPLISADKKGEPVVDIYPGYAPEPGSLLLQPIWLLERAGGQIEQIDLKLDLPPGGDPQ